MSIRDAHKKITVYKTASVGRWLSVMPTGSQTIVLRCSSWWRQKD